MYSNAKNLVATDGTDSEESFLLGVLCRGRRSTGCIGPMSLRTEKKASHRQHSANF